MSEKTRQSKAPEGQSVEAFTIRLPASVLRNLRFVARYNDISMNRYVQQILDRSINDDLAAINRDDRGRVSEDEE